LHLPIQNPLTSRVGQSSVGVEIHYSPKTLNSRDSQDDEQFSDDSLEGQIWSSDRDLSSGRDDIVSRGESAKDELKAQSQSRSSIAWDIDWNEKKSEEKESQEKEKRGKFSL
jgi:hypothetical protein